MTKLQYVLMREAQTQGKAPRVAKLKKGGVLVMEAGNPTSPGTFAGSPAPGAAQGSTPQSGHTPRQTPLTPTQSVQGLPALTERVSRQERQLELMNEGIRRTEELL
jgi:hypothetical protein